MATHIDKSDWNDLAGYLCVKQHYKGLKKLRSSRRKLWCIFDEATVQLQYYKSPKDAFVKLPTGSINLKGASFYFENAELFEFIINVGGKEHLFKADSHDKMMDWLKRLREKVYPNEDTAASLAEKRTKSLDFETITDDEILFQKPVQFSMSCNNLTDAPSASGNKRKRRIFLPWSFRRSDSNSSGVKPKSSSSTLHNGEHMITPESLHQNNSSLNERSASTGKKWKCKSCAALSAQNTFLSEEVQKLTERLREAEREAKFHSNELQHLRVENLVLKKDLVSITQDMVSQDEENDASIEYNRHCDKIIEMLEAARVVNKQLPDYKSATSTMYTDSLGFIHGERESPAQAFQYCCEQLKKHYVTEAKGKDLVRKWEEFLQRQDNEALSYSVELKRLVLEGVPHDFRAELWKRLISNKVKNIKAEKGEDYYQKLSLLVPDIEDVDNEDDDSVEKQIRIDLLRTMPTNSSFKSMESEGVQMLHRVLLAFLFHRPEIGYCQGMNFMVAMGLLYLEEEDAFWLLVAVTEVYFSSKHYNHYLTGSQADQKVLEELASERLVDVLECLKETGCELSPVTFNWLMTIFIESVPIEVGLRIWDCFLTEGHSVLYRFSLALLKMNEGGLYIRTDMLSQMKYLKKIGRQIHDIDYLLKLAFEGFEPFPTSNELGAIYEKHFSVIQEQNVKREQADKEYENQQKMKRLQPKTISVCVDRDLGELPEDFLIECCETEENANKVWLCCSTHNVGILFVLDIVNRYMVSVEQEIKSRCLCMTRSNASRTMIIGTADATLHGFDIDSREQIWSVQVDDSVSSISCDKSGNIVATLASGSIAVSQQNPEAQRPESPIYLHIGRAPVVCGCICDNYFWCGCGNNIVIMDTDALDEIESIQVCPNLRHSISKLMVGDFGVWCCVRGSSVLQLFDKKNFTCLMTTDVMNESGLASEKISHLSSTRITAILPRKNEIWVGLGNGRFLIFDIKTGSKPISESTDDIDPEVPEDESSPRDEDEMKPRAVSQAIDIANEIPSCCHETLIKKDASKLSSFSLGDSGFVFVSKLSSSNGSLDVDDRYHLRLKQLQRISEEPVRCLNCVRHDNKQILSCVGAISDDLSIVLWSCEKRDGKEMWYEQTVSYAIKETECNTQYTNGSKLKTL